MERGKLPEIPVPAWPQTATARLTNHPLSNREFLEVPFNVFHLVEDPQKVLAWLNDLLAARGLLIAQVPCLGDWGWVMRSMLGLAQKIGWAPTIHNFTVPEMEALVTDANFAITESKNYDARQVVQWIVAHKT